MLEMTIKQIEKKFDLVSALVSAESEYHKLIHKLNNVSVNFTTSEQAECIDKLKLHLIDMEYMDDYTAYLLNLCNEFMDKSSYYYEQYVKLNNKAIELS